MADETFYNPGDKSYELLATEMLLNKFPELNKSGHYDFNSFLAQYPELQGQTDKYNVLGGMDIAKRIQPGPKKWTPFGFNFGEEPGYDWSDPYSLSGLGGLYALYDSSGNPDQSFKEGFADWFRNMKGIGIQRDVNPLGLLYDDDEADYYKGYYNKIYKDYQKMQADRWQKDKLRQLHSEDIFGGTFERPGRVPPVKFPPGKTENVMPSGGEKWSPAVGGGQRGSNAPGFTDPGRGSYGPWKADGGLATMFERRR
jgi:hypothetical protein